MLAALLEEDEQPSRKRRRRLEDPPPDAEPAPAQPHGGISPFRRWLLTLYAKGRLSAQAVTDGSHSVEPHAEALQVSDIALPALGRTGKRQGGNSERLLSAALHQDEFIQQNVFYADVPCHDKRTGERVLRKLPMLLPHERVHALAAEDLSAVLTPADVHDLPRVAACPLVQELGAGAVALLRLYVDGVPFTGRARKAQDSVICVYWAFALRGPREQRRLVTCFRKSEMCRTCGCNGRCTLDTVFRVLNWSISCLRSGQWPDTGPMGAPLDAGRLAKRGQLAVRGDVIELGADWGELNHSFGLRSWTANVGPCSKCCRTQDCLHDYTRPHSARTAADYNRAVADATVSVVVTQAEAAQIEAALEFDLRQNGARGRAMTTRVGALLPGDRLEVGGAVSDTCCNVSTLPAYPATLVFWRRRPTDWINWRCPLMGEGGCLSIENILVDLLHTVDAGVCQYFSGQVFALLLRTNSYNVQGGDEAVRFKRSAFRIEQRLFEWYRTHPQSSEYQHVTPGVLLGSGGVERPCSKGKAMESRGLFRFALSEIRRLGPQLAADPAGPEVGRCATHLQQAGEQLERFFTLIHEHPRKMPREAARAALVATLSHTTHMRNAPSQLAPKHHWMWELATSLERNGSPLMYSTYVDEDCNQVFANIGRSVHALTFTISSIKKYRVLCLVRGQEP